MKKIYCIYHKGCLDGFAAAWVVRRAFLGENIIFLGGVYGQSAPEIDPNSIVCIVDFSYSRKILLEMAENNNVIVLDHHKSAKEQLKDLPFIEFDMNKSGAVMTWEYFFENKSVPPFISYIQDRDLWKFELKDSKEVNAALFSYPMEFEIWDTLAAKSIHSLRDEGKVLLRDRQRHIDSFSRGWAITSIDIGGHIVPCLNCPRFLASDVLHILAKNQPFAASYFDSADKRSFELRSDAENGLDVSKIAAQYGGGGHKHAAGFIVERPPMLGEKYD